MWFRVILRAIIKQVNVFFQDILEIIKMFTRCSILMCLTGLFLEFISQHFSLRFYRISDSQQIVQQAFACELKENLEDISPLGHLLTIK